MLQSYRMYLTLCTVQYCNKRDMKIVEHISTLSPLYLPGGDRPSLLAGEQLEIVQSYPDTYIPYGTTYCICQSRGVGPYVCTLYDGTYVLPIMNHPRPRFATYHMYVCTVRTIRLRL